MLPRVTALMILTLTVTKVTGKNQMRTNILDNCGTCSSTENNGKLTLDCSDRGFTSVPNCGMMNVTKLFLGHNNILTVKACDFKHMPMLEYLDLSYTNLTRIKNKAFSGLDNLVYMNLDGNKLGGTSFESEIFKDIKNLQNLDIRSNDFVNNKTLLDHTLFALRNINTLLLSMQNGFVFGEEFQALGNLKSLYVDGNKIHLHNDTFSGLAGMKIRNLTISASFVDTGAFVPLKYITGLSISSKEYIPRILESLVAFVNKTMHYLDLGSNAYVSENYLTITTRHMRYLSLICVERLILRDDKIQDIELAAIQSLKYKHCIRYLDLSRNIMPRYRLFFIAEFPNLETLNVCCRDDIDHKRFECQGQNNGDAISTQSSSSKKLSQTVKREISTHKRLEIKERQFSYLQHAYKSPATLHIQRSKPLQRQRRRIQNGEDLSNADDHHSTKPILFLYSTNKLKVVNASYLHARSADLNVNIINGNNIKVLDLAYNKLTCMFIIKGLHNLETLNISKFQCCKLDPVFLRYFPNLKHFVAIDARLNIGFRNDKNGNFFLGLTKLEYINLANNDLSILHRGLFSHQAKSMKRLILSGNKLMAFPRIFEKLFFSLRDIDLQNNDISYLSVRERTEINNLIVNSKNNLNIYFKGNTFQCSCTAIEMLQWFAMHISVFKDSVDVLCTNPSGKKVNLQKQIKNLQTLKVICISNFWLIFSICGIIVLVIVLITSVIGYRNKIALEFCCLKMKWFLNRYEPLITTHTYDAFIAYSNQDTHWVVHSLRNFLEDELNLKVCFYGRDFIPSRSIADEIFDGIQESRNIVFVITRDFIESEWMVYELEQTRLHMFRKYREHNVILILKDHIPISELPDIVQTLWSRIVCLEYPEDENAEHLTVFWKKLDRAFTNQPRFAESVQDRTGAVI